MSCFNLFPSTIRNSFQISACKHDIVLVLLIENWDHYCRGIYYLYNAGSPISPNPFILKNASSFTLLWSPPFLWPGWRIQHYNISVTDTNDGDIAHHMVNTTSTSPLISLPLPVGFSSGKFNALSCMTFRITPVCDGTPSNSDPVQVFNISGWTWTFPSGKLYIKS